MPTYQHVCRDCEYEWLEEYSLEQFDEFKREGINLMCLQCLSTNTYRAVGHVPVHFKGAGWSPQGYYKFEAYDQLEREGKKVTRYDDRNEMKRVMKGEKAEAVKKRLKREDELAKRHFGPDAALTEEKAQARIDKEVQKVEETS